MGQAVNEDQMLSRWKSYVERAKKIHKRMMKDRLEIAKLAVEACDIKHGGGAHWKNFQGIYTLNKFAHEVGINYKTLHTWVKVYRLVKSQLPASEWDENNWPAALRTASRVTSKTPRQEVRKTYREERLKNGEALSLVVITKRMTTYATALLGFAARDLATADLAELALASTAISQWAEQELKDRYSKGGLALSKQQQARLAKRAEYLETGIKRRPQDRTMSAAV